jgi:uncharacterized coiled-coil protein SlyX
MKKKIINGFLMVALLAATSTSFVSCKDNSEDVRTDILAQIADLDIDYATADAKLKSEIQTELNNKVNKADLATTLADYAKLTDLNNYPTKVEMNNAITTALNDYATKKYVDDETKKLWDALGNYDNPKSVASRIQELETASTTQTNDINGIKTDVTDIKNDLTDINNRIDAIIDALTDMVTSVTVNATSTNILENSKLFPGVNMQFLGAIYGEAKKDVTFPDIEGVNPEFTAEQGDLLYNKERGAGKVYFTVNPSNIDESKIANLTLSLTDSKNGTSLITLGKAKASDKYLAWGTRADGDVTLWEADATANPEKLGQIAPAELINLKQVAEHVKDMVKAAKSVDKSASSVKNATKDILKETSALIADLAQTKLPALPALALKAQWNDVVGTRSVISDYSIAATSFKPVDFYWGQGIVPESASISFEKIDKIALDIVNKIKAQEPDMTKYIINGIEFNPTTNTLRVDLYNVEAPAGQYPYAEVNISTLNGDLQKIADDLNANLDMLNGAISDIQNILNKVNNAGANALTLEKKVTNYLENYINRIISSISANGLYKLLEPMVLVENENGGVNRLVSGVTLKAGKVTLLPTTVTNELLAPAFKKYIAVNGEGGKVLTNGDDNFKKYEITLVQGKNVITYAALDFYGNQVVKTFTVTAE